MLICKAAGKSFNCLDHVRPKDKGIVVADNVELDVVYKMRYKALNVLINGFSQ